MGSYKHGMSGTPIYRMWQSVLNRCQDTNNVGYKYYGGRGIKVCDRWKDFRNFVNDMAPRPRGSQIDRINNNGNYEPGNCRWVTPKINCNNRRSNKLITFLGKTLTRSQWEEEKGFSTNTILQRLKRGWTIEECLTIPSNQFKRRESTKKTHCPNGHEYILPNFYINKSNGAKQCKICDRNRKKKLCKKK